MSGSYNLSGTGSYQGGFDSNANVDRHQQLRQDEITEEEQRAQEGFERVIVISEAEKERVKLAAQLLVMSPPGQLFDLLNDIRVIINNDDALSDGVTPIFDAYSLATFGTVQPPNKDYEIILSTYNQLEFGLFYDPISGEKFMYNSLQEHGEFVDEHIERDPHYEIYRLTLQDTLKGFVDDFFPAGISNVFQGEQCIHLCYVANLASPTNYWSGRWLADWKYNMSQSTLTGTINIKVHYYEDGNVQLNSSKDYSSPLTKMNADDVAIEIRQLLIKFNEEMRSCMNVIFEELSDTSAKFLRRALPITKAKIDWDKINVYPTGDIPLAQ